MRALLIDLDGVLYVEEEPIAGAVEALERLRGGGLTLRFVTNTTAHSREHTLAKLARLGVSVTRPELVTPASLAVEHCRARGYQRVALIMNDEVTSDFAELHQAGDHCDAVIIGDLGPAFGYDVLNHAFRQVVAGAELIALQKNRYWMRADGLSLDVGPFVAAIEFAAGCEAYVVGKPARTFFDQVLAGMEVTAARGGRWWAMTSSPTSAERCALGLRPSSYALANTARSGSAPPVSDRPRSSDRSPTCRRCSAADHAHAAGAGVVIAKAVGRQQQIVGALRLWTPGIRTRAGFVRSVLRQAVLTPSVR